MLTAGLMVIAFVVGMLVTLLLLDDDRRYIKAQRAVALADRDAVLEAVGLGPDRDGDWLPGGAA